MSHFENLKEQLPSKEKFYSSLTGTRVSDKEYQHVSKVWNKFEMKKMKDYHYLCLKCDVSLLADAFEKSRNNSSKSYGLCLSHSLSAPAIRLYAMFNMKKVELIPDPDMYILFDKVMRSGVSFIFNRYSRASNKYLKMTQNKNEDILYT